MNFFNLAFYAIDSGTFKYKAFHNELLYQKEWQIMQKKKKNANELLPSYSRGNEFTQASSTRKHVCIFAKTASSVALLQRNILKEK